MSSRRQISIPLAGRYRQVSLYIWYKTKAIALFITSSVYDNPTKVCIYCDDKKFIKLCVYRERKFCSMGLNINCKRYQHQVSFLQYFITSRWRHNGRDSVFKHQPHDCLLNRLFRRRSKKTSKLRITGLYVGNSPGTGDAENECGEFTGDQ